ncbi:translation initiation factor IF-5A [Candidatus Woesearchaeota archaeon]|nr:translation initiation factor IF-5A [Candidatus Woesearchaeota archaeon]
MSIKLTTAGQVQKGDTVLMDGEPCRVTSVQISRPGKHGHAKVRMEGVGLIDEKKRVIVLPGHDKMEVPIIDKKSAQVLSINDDMANVMDMETYETFDLKIPEELKDQVVAGGQIVYWKIMSYKILKQVK